MSGLLGNVKVSQFEYGIYDNCIITGIDTKDRKGANGPINKMIYTKIAQIDPTTGKRKSESELSWWKPEAGSDYFIDNLQQLCLQLHGIVEAYIGEDAAFEVFSPVFEEAGVTSAKDVLSKVWKKSEIDVIFTSLKECFTEAIAPFVGKKGKTIRVKITTNYRGEDVEIPKYGKFTESMDITEPTLVFSSKELQTHSKAGNVETKANTGSKNIKGTI